jgi:putative phosphoribosyl transferase
MHSAIAAQSFEIPVDRGSIGADLNVPERAAGLVIFAHGSGSSRLSSRNRAVAEHLYNQRFATLLVDLLTPAEESVDVYTAQHRFDIDLLARRVVLTTDWARSLEALQQFPVGYFGASTGAAAALIAAAERPTIVRTVVSRGGRPDLADRALANVQAPTLLIVGGNDEPVIKMNREAQLAMTTKVTLEIVPGATHLFEEPGALERVMELATNWFREHLA